MNNDSATVELLAETLRGIRLLAEIQAEESKAWGSALVLIDRALLFADVKSDELLVESLAKLIYVNWDGSPEYAPWVDGGNSWKQDEARSIAKSHIAARPFAPSGGEVRMHSLDTPTRVCFYEQDYYVLSNFSAFSLEWNDRLFPTSEAAYQSEKFMGSGSVKANWDLVDTIKTARSAHEAFKIAERNRALRRPDWDQVKVRIMRVILRAKARQHEYVLRKLLATGDRDLVENSWRDDFWGWGPNQDGQNMLGKLWMEVRDEFRSAGTAPPC